MALTEFREKHIIHGEFSALWADDILLENGTHAIIRKGYLSNVAVEFPTTLFAFEVNLHTIVEFLSHLRFFFPLFGALELDFLTS